jgi:hypothetical protein
MYHLVSAYHFFFLVLSVTIHELGIWWKTCFDIPISPILGGVITFPNFTCYKMQSIPNTLLSVSQFLILPLSIYRRNFVLTSVVLFSVSHISFHILYFSIDNAHSNIFVTPFDVQITSIRQLAVELGSTDRGRRNSLKARALIVVTVAILSLMKNFLDLNSLMFNKY